MKLSTVAALSLGAAPLVAAGDESQYTVTRTVTYESQTYTITSTHNTHTYGRFNKTPKSHTPKPTGTHRYGKFNNTHGEERRARETSEFLMSLINAAPGQDVPLGLLGLPAAGAFLAGAMLLL